mgnify:CR=1 FL=1
MRHKYKSLWRKSCRITAIAMFCSYSLTLHSQVITEAAIKQARTLVEQMTLKEKIEYLSGKTSFTLRAIPRLGIPEIRLADGPQGIRNHTPNSTLFPCGIMTASTWDRSLALRYGQSLGDDARARKVGILLGPGVNIYRAPMCGRNFEYFGEDPYLTGEVASNYIQGVQSRGVIATIKHFCGNNQEWSRHHASSDIDERTLNEIYFPAFRKAVEVAHVGAVMNSYNLLNGVHATENAWLNKTMLRQNWGFKGILMSDWTSVYSTVNTANNGLDLEMPKGKFFNEQTIIPALETGRITMETIDLKVQHILQTLIAFGLFEQDHSNTIGFPLDNPESHKTALDVTRGGIVLLRNEGNALPLKGRTAILGENADIVTTGGGSGFVEPYSSTPLAEALVRERDNTIKLTDDIIFDDIASQVYTDEKLTDKGICATYYKKQKIEGKADSTAVISKIDFDWGYKSIGTGFPEDHFSAQWSFYYPSDGDGMLRLSLGGDDGYRIFLNDSLLTGDWGNHSYSSREVAFPVKKGKIYHFVMQYFDNISSAKVKCDITRLNERKLNDGLAKVSNIIYCTGFNSDIEGEGFDRNFHLTNYQEGMIHSLSKYNKKLVVVINAGGGVAMNDWIDRTQAVVMAWHGGQEGGTALAEILTGKISPSGKLPISIERRWEDNPCHESYYANIKGKEGPTIEYTEGIFTGYRGYDHLKRQPLFPFGFGLSYTNFIYSDLKLTRHNNDINVTFTIRNTGKCAGAEVAQLYVCPVNPSVKRPEKELKGFEKIFLKKGESRTVNICLNNEAFMYYNIDKHDFVIDPGKYIIRIGGSSQSLPLKESINID